MSWIINVYWTLGIEFQYYLLVGLIYPALLFTGLLAEGALLLACSAAVGFRFPFPGVHIQGEQGPLVGHYAFVFLLGFLAFRYRSGIIGIRRYWLLTGIAAFGASSVCGPLIGIFALGTSAMIAFTTLRSPLLAYLGSISYSLYLLHYLVVGRILGLGLRFVHSPLLVLLLEFTAIVVSIAVAHVATILIEKPSMRLAQRIALRCPDHNTCKQPSPFAQSAPVFPAGTVSQPLVHVALSSKRD